MRLKCIKLAGFKSFVDPTTVNFPSSLCSVVGPNGCGKSNVIDAVRWVMGESSAKNLRGENMTDVIFNGSGNRKPVGQASVELVFDNSDHRLRGEYANFSEVSIKRKVDRDAQSTYSLNGTKCRRKDVTDIFLGTGLGARSYSIIEQGMVSRLIESKPEELRVYIEEAAGISKYKERRRETENRIKRTRDNLERLTDIREEMGRQLSHLQRQSVAAEKYGLLKQEERVNAARLNGLKWRELDSDLAGTRAKISELEIQIEAIIAQQREIDATVERQLLDNTELNDALGEVQAKYYSLGNDIARIEQSIEHQVERADQLRIDLSETEETWQQTREEMNADLQRVTTLSAELEELEPVLAMSAATEAESAEILLEAEEAMGQWQQQWDEFVQRSEEPRQVAEVEQSRIQQLELIIERGLARKSSLEAERTQLLQSGSDEQLSQLSTELSAMETELALNNAKNQEFTGLLNEDRTALQLCQQELSQVRSSLQSAAGTQASLEALQEAAIGRDDRALSEWVSQRGLTTNSRLGESLEVEAGWEYAVETVLGDQLQGLCVSEEELVSTLADLPQLSLSLVSASSETSASGQSNGAGVLLRDKLSSPHGLGDLLDGIYVAEDLPQALATRDSLAAGESIVTPEGVWLASGWLRINHRDAAETGLLERKGLIEENINKINTLEGESNRLSEKESALKARLENHENERVGLQQQIANLNQRYSDTKSKVSADLAKIEQSNQRKQRIAHELEELVKQMSVEQENTAQSRARLQTALDSMEEDVALRESLVSERDARRSSLEEKRNEYRKNKDLSHEHALKHQSLGAQLQSTRETMDRMATQVQRARERMDSLNQQIESSEDPLLSMKSDLENLLERRLEVEKELNAAKAKVDENEHTLRSLEQRRNSVQETLNTTREALMEQRLKNEGASVKQQGIVQQLEEADQVLEEVLQQLPEGLLIGECEAELERVSNRIQRLGPINLAAIDEFKQQSERKVYLDKQNEDLERALATLENAIRKIDKETRTRFKETFDKINAGLQALFPRVFGGGHAYLDMTGEDLLDTGVAIMARPPGKRNSTIHLLSGGEKAMTAIALVFSIFQLNPSPFCMLDEVDAPLDDANVGRYANLVREMSESVQFIFITHNKITMEMANQLLGVTMHEPGVSRIVAVDIAEAAELAAM